MKLAQFWRSSSNCAIFVSHRWRSLSQKRHDARKSSLIPSRAAVLLGLEEAEKPRLYAAFHQKGRVVVPPAHSVCAFVTGVSVLELPNGWLTARVRCENSIARSHTRRLLNRCLLARHRSLPAGLLRPTAYQEVFLTSADLRHRRNRDCQQNEASNPSVGASANR